MRTTVSLLAIATLAACGQATDQPQTPVTQMDAIAPPPVAYEGPSDRLQAPGITPTSAPGVAFNYRYAFRMPAERISEVQEQHAAACEKLGLDRCRITGMRYRLINDRDIEAMLAFRLDPTLARQFGKQGIEAVGAAEGMLVDSEISGRDVGSEIGETDRGNAQLRDELERVERELRRSGLKASERVELQAQAERLRQTLRANQTTQSERRESLASTPMVFQYGSGNLAPGFDSRPSIQAALEQAGANFVDGVALLLVFLLTLLPWGLAVALVAWIYRRFLRKRWHGLGVQPAAEQG